MPKFVSNSIQICCIHICLDQKFDIFNGISIGYSKTIKSHDFNIILILRKKISDKSQYKVSFCFSILFFNFGFIITYREKQEFILLCKQ